MKMSDGGKGDGQRPSSVDHQTFSNNWDAIFGKKKVVEEEPEKRQPPTPWYYPQYMHDD